MLAVLAAACGSERTTEPDVSAARGQLVTATLASSTTATTAAIAIALAGGGVGFSAKYAVEMYSITYRTIDVEGKPTVASGAVFLPVGASGSVPLLSYSHGTASSRTAVPSNPQSQEGPSTGVLFATGGAVVAMADYLGLGSNPGFHPYIHAASEASAGLDALRAARLLADRQHVALSGKLFVFGYSQGGHAAMALAREVEQHATPEFTLTAAAPMSGPYDVTGTATAFLLDSTPNTAASGYTIMAVAAYDSVYHLAARLDQLFRPPYDSLAAAYLAGTLTSDDLSRRVAPVPRTMIQPSVVASLDDPQSAVARALHDNDVYDWRPRAPMRLYYGSADRDVPPRNALTASARMRALGADVQAVDLGPYSHGQAVLPAFSAANAWFGTMR